MVSNIDIVTAHYAASDRKDVVGMLSVMSDKVEWTEMEGFPCAGTWVGPDAVMENVFRVLGNAWDDFGFALERLVDGGDVIVGIGTYTGIYRSTGKALRVRASHVWGLEDGKVVRFEQFTDTLLVANAML